VDAPSSHRQADVVETGYKANRPMGRRDDLTGQSGIDKSAIDLSCYFPANVWDCQPDRIQRVA
jgi:hypothetical protein